MVSHVSCYPVTLRQTDTIINSLYYIDSLLHHYRGIFTPT